MHWDVHLERKSLNRLPGNSTRDSLRRIADSAERNKGLGFTAKVIGVKGPELIAEEIEGEIVEFKKYVAKVRLYREAPDPEDAEKKFRHVLIAVEKAAGSKENGGWRVVSDQPAESAPEGPEGLPPRTPFVVPELTPAVHKKFFHGIYNRAGHIRLLHDSVRTFVDTLEMNRKDPRVEVARSHTLLKGKPGSCKTKLFEKFKAWYEHGSDVERIKLVDGPTMSKAGLENHLLTLASLGQLPEVVLIEEIEKQDVNNLLTLVSLMGSGYISKLNAKVGHRRELANVVIWATCNDENVVREFRSGVLWSRFAHRWHCPLPDQPLMEKILLDRVKEMDGDPRWVEAVMDLVYRVLPDELGMKMTDPREIKGLLSGRTRLLDGGFQKDLLEIFKLELAEREEEIEEESESLPIRRFV